jgi:hypothetical protein
MNCFKKIQEAYAIRILPTYDVSIFKTATLVHVSDLVKVYRAEDGNWLYCCNNGISIPYVVASPDFQQITGYALEIPGEEIVSILMRFLLRTAFESRFCYESTVSLHAACVEADGMAVCFTGDSGVGKSTRAMAWCDALGAEFISGDRPAVRIEKDGGIACGVPWDGKEQIFRDVERPLKAILEVRRSPVTHVRRLSSDQAYHRLIRQCFVPMWDTDTAVFAMANMRKLCRTVSVYRLFCGPDAADAQEAYRILFNHPEEIQEELPEMQLKQGFVLRNVADEYMVMPTNENIDKFNGTVVLSETAAFIFEQLKQPISREDLLTAMLAEFDVDEATAARDLDALLAQFRELGLLED